MSTRLLPIVFVICLLHLHAPSAIALTMAQFSEICDTAPHKCSDHPVVQSYVGGALDLLATLKEKTHYLGKVYCGEPKELFDVPVIVGFMLQRREEYATENAMLVLVRYFEERGGCKNA